ncbi:isochorismate synthase [Erwinia sp. S43]|uniref:isochorismate synthase n=1 Tax=unclassified Erwinia TaxID=2622719 RepID=UPI00190E1650|nr:MULTISPECIES: isochorismate synthase [unclassified Erwinia]MBK0034165.1 isochorismate synthase [Erwinia sp. S43]MCW1876944.1 isochorismate synthase [Erwinia sp. INIA01]
MELLTSESTLQFAADAAASGFFFMSPWRSLAAKGCFTTINTPAYEGEMLTGRFQHDIRHHLSEAKRQGIRHPVVVGAIPFDVRQPSALFIPETSHFFDRSSFQRQVQTHGSSHNDILRRTALPEQPEFMRMVSEAIAATASSQLDKVVLSRLMDIVTEKPVDVAGLMQQLIAQNPTSYNFHVPLAQGGSLLGASPELLLRMHDRRYYTHPLAGSAKRDSDRERDRAAGQQLMKSQKDRYEHQLVIDALRHVLQSRSKRLAIPAEPELLTTGTLWHLGTPIEGEVSHAAENALSLACLLHPTPALSGYPHASAMQMIAKLEPFERDLFGGIVGWCDEHGNGEWVVTIRCGKVAGNRVRLFAGAGIVPDSTPESEWRETGVKLNTMLRAFGLN